MIAAKSLQEAVYGQIFPGGMIPVACKDNIPAIDARIREIEQLAKGVPLLGEVRRLTKRDSLALTDRIIELRESCSPPMGYKEIMRRLGNVVSPEAARNRYDDAKRAMEAATMQKEGYAAISGETMGLHGPNPIRPPAPIDDSGHFSGSTNMIEREDHFVGLGKMVPNACDDPGTPVYQRVSAGVTPAEKIETDILPAAQPALLETKPDDVDRPYTDRSDATPKILKDPILSEHPTIRDSRIVQKPGEVKPDDATLRNVAADIPESIKGMKLSDFENGKGPLRQDQKDKILEMWDQGFKVPDIQCSLGIKDGRKITGVIRARELHKKKGPQNEALVQPEAAKPQSLPGAEGAPEPARANPRGTPEKGPEPKSISRAELDEKIWKSWDNGKGKTPIQISDELCEEGLYYGEQSVVRRLRQQGARI
jgi:hypothetical protein